MKTIPIITITFVVIGSYFYFESREGQPATDTATQNIRSAQTDIQTQPSSAKPTSELGFSMIAGSAMDGSVVLKSEEGELTLVKTGEHYADNYVVYQTGDKRVILQERSSKDLIVIERSSGNESTSYKRVSNQPNEKFIAAPIRHSSGTLEN